ncbi:hypothetical protein G3O07_22740 [Pseudomonas laurentiana]|uniref:Uncharacterized protein n=3 Tax=Pseudomonas laurentiana TaxID=2364649 RepID=A0A6I5RW90_9PSED|nr:hypothetical protein [Pseudomonas laurentiana]
MPQLSATLATLQAQGTVVAASAQYRDQYPFSLRLTKPLQLIPEGDELAWAQANPTGVLLVNHKAMSAEQRQAALITQTFRGSDAALWPATTLTRHPDYLSNERVEDANATE